ncbi:MAG: S41 family peptidase [Candidatus Paceibacterota bacterium]|jgi:carboxyl-terminal processing protease
MKDYKIYAVGAAVFIIVIGGVFWLGLYFGYNNQPYILRFTGISSKEPVEIAGEADFAPFWKAWALLNENFVDNSTSSKKVVTNQDRVWGAVSGLTDSLGDPYTVFMPPEKKTRFDEDIAGNFGGLGMEVGVRDGMITVISPLPDSPAKKAGIMSGDVIAKVGATSTASMSLDEAIKYMRGPKGTKVHLALLREKVSQPIEIDVVRDTIILPTIETKELTGGVYQISLFNFSAQSPNLFRDALEKFLRSGSDKLILDLRGNPGGYLEASVDIASWFLPEGKVIVKEERGKNKVETIYRSKGYDIFTKLNRKVQMIVLVDQGSASAAEILAGALSENGVAKLVGQKTFGKGSVQELIPVTGDTSLKVTVARWLTPNGNSISHSGITPDTLVAITAEDVKKGIDPQKDKAVKMLLGK